MVKHIVMWNFKEGTAEADKQNFKRELEGLVGTIDGLLKLEVGFDFANGASSSDVVLYSEVTDRATLDAYQAHPEHKRVGKAFVVPFVCDRHAVDFEV